MVTDWIVHSHLFFMHTGQREYAANAARPGAVMAVMIEQSGFKQEESMSKKKVGIIIGAVVVVAAAAAVAVWKFGGNAGHDSNDRVYVEKVSTIMGNAAGMQNRYAGLVQPQKTVNINADSERTIKEFFVKEGDTVEEGTPLFVYNTDDIELELEQAKLEIENTDLEISGYRSQIAELEKERNAASEDSKFEYTTEIQTIQTKIRQAEYDKSNKKLDIEKTQKKIDNSEVVSTASGVVKTLNDPKTSDSNGNSGGSGDSNATISIMVTGTYRVKGTLDEQTINMITPGSNVIIRSRVDENQTWNGVVDNIDTGETANSNDEDSMWSSGGSDSGENSASKYPFYISLDNADGLILGQHVYIELDEGQTAEKEGLWLYASYIATEEGPIGSPMTDNGFMDGMDAEFGGESLYDTEAEYGDESLSSTEAEFSDEVHYSQGPEQGVESLSDTEAEPGVESLSNTEAEYGDESLFGTETGLDFGTDNSDPYIASDITDAFVWADDGNGRLIKKPVQLGEYDPMMDEYQILSGLTEDDYIAWPMEGLYEGVRTVTNAEDVDYSSGLYNQDGTESLEGFDTEMLDGGDMLIDNGSDGEAMPLDENGFGTETMYPADITDIKDSADTEEVSE